MKKSNLPPARGFGQPPSVDPFKKCLTCGLIMSDDMPRGVVVESNEVKGVQCISCCESDESATKLGTPKNPLKFEEDA